MASFPAVGMHLDPTPTESPTVLDAGHLASLNNECKQLASKPILPCAQHLVCSLVHEITDAFYVLDKNAAPLNAWLPAPAVPRHTAASCSVLLPNASWYGQRENRRPEPAPDKPGWQTVGLVS